MKRNILLGIASLSVATALVVGLVFGQWTLSPSGSGTVSNCTPTATVTVGNVTGLFPGATATANLSVANTSSCISPGINFDYNAASVTVSLVSGDSANCPDSNFTSVYNFVDDGSDDHAGTSTSHVAQGGTDVDTITVALISAAPDGCQGVAASLDATVVLTQD